MIFQFFQDLDALACISLQICLGEAMKSLGKQLEYIDPKSIQFDSDNPRGLTEKQITNDPEFAKLVLSIRKFGVLEPLIIKPNEKGTPPYILIDGERRLRASLKIPLSTVPVLIAKDDADGRILAYHVHMLRENWSKAAETKAIKKIIYDLKLKDSTITDARVSSELIKITTHKSHEIGDIMILCKYDDYTIERILSDRLYLSYPVQIEKSFIRPLRRKFSSVAQRYGDDEIRKILMQKVFMNKLGNTRYLMDHFKIVFNDNSYH